MHLSRLLKRPSSFYKLWTVGTAANEYYLVENRQKTGYDSGLPASGLAIFHVDNSRFNNTKEWYPGYTTFGHYWVAVEQADGLFELEKGMNRGNIGDTYPGSSTNRTFDFNSLPNSKAYSGALTKVAVKNISNSGSTMTADIWVTDPASIEQWMFFNQ